MNLRVVLATLLIIGLLLSLAGCGQQEPTHVPSAKPVNIMTVEEELTPVTLSYLGTVGASQVRKLAFKSSGRIVGLLVEQGEQVTAGQRLAFLEDNDLQYAFEGAKGRLKSIQAQYDKAISGATEEELNQVRSVVQQAVAARDFTLDNYIKLEKLFDEGAIPKQELNKAKLELELRQEDLNQAQEKLHQLEKGTRLEDVNYLLGQLKQAQADYEHKQKMLEETVLFAQIPGKVLETLVREGEFVSGGYPAIVLAGEQQIVNVGIVETDLGKVGLGSRAIIAGGSLQAEGVVTKIAPLPDKNTRTYNVEISLEENIFNLGAQVQVDLILGQELGIWIPLTSIRVDGNDYVYVVNTNRAVKKLIQIEQVKDTRVKIQGLSPGEQLVVGGMKRLMPNDQVTVVERGSEQP